MRALLLLAALLALLGAAHATYGDNGLTTYTGRKREPNTLVFGNDMVSQQATQATLSMAKDLLKGNWRPVRNDPPTEKRKVGRSADCLAQYRCCAHLPGDTANLHTMPDAELSAQPRC